MAIKLKPKKIPINGENTSEDKDMKKIIIVLVIIGAVIGFFAFDLNQLITLENIKSHQAEFQQWRDSAPVLVSLLFFTALWTGDPTGGDLNLRVSGEHTHFYHPDFTVGI